MHFLKKKFLYLKWEGVVVTVCYLEKLFMNFTRQYTLLSLHNTNAHLFLKWKKKN